MKKRIFYLFFLFTFSIQAWCSDQPQKGLGGLLSPSSEKSSDLTQERESYLERFLTPEEWEILFKFLQEETPVKEKSLQSAELKHLRSYFDLLARLFIRKKEERSIDLISSGWLVPDLQNNMFFYFYNALRSVLEHSEIKKSIHHVPSFNKISMQAFQKLTDLFYSLFESQMHPLGRGHQVLSFQHGQNPVTLYFYTHASGRKVPFSFRKNVNDRFFIPTLEPIYGWIQAEKETPKRAYWIQDDQPVMDSGLVLERNNRRGQKLTLTFYQGDVGERPFQILGCNLRISSSENIDRFLVSLASSLVIQESTPKLPLFIPIPHLDKRSSELLALSFILDQAQADSEQRRFLEIECRKRGQDLQTLQTQLEQKLLRDDFLEEATVAIRREQEARSRAVREDRVPSIRQSSQRGRRQAKQDLPPQKESLELSQTVIDAKARELLAEHTTRVGKKYRHVLKSVYAIEKEFQMQSPLLSNFFSMNQRGSHLNFHFPEGGTTLVRPHGGQDSFLDAWQINELVQTLVDSYSALPKTGE